MKKSLFLAVFLLTLLPTVTELGIGVCWAQSYMEEMMSWSMCFNDTRGYYTVFDNDCGNDKECRECLLCCDNWVVEDLYEEHLLMAHGIGGDPDGPNDPDPDPSSGNGDPDEPEGLGTSGGTGEGNTSATGYGEPDSGILLPQVNVNGHYDPPTPNFMLDNQNYSDNGIGYIGGGGTSNGSKKVDESSTDNNKEIGYNDRNKFGENFSLYEFEIIKKLENIHTIENDLYKNPPPTQDLLNECVAMCGAYMTSLMDEGNYNDVWYSIFFDALSFGYDLSAKNNAIPLDLTNKLLYEHAGIECRAFDKNDIYSEIDSNKPVLAIVDTGEYIYENYVEAESDKISITHMVTIIGYDIFNFYCAVGEGSTVTRIPQLSFLQNYMYTKK